MVSFKLENIGLIEKTQLTLNNFTLICGQNNTGKTYITYSIYGFLYSWNNMVDFDIPQEVFRELNENGFYSLDILAYETKVKDILEELSMQYTRSLGNVFSVGENWFDKSKFEVFIDNFKLDLSFELKSTLSSAKKDVLQIKKSANSHILEVSTLSSSNQKQIPKFILQNGINRALGEIYFKQYFKHPFIITSERTGISLFYKELDINKNVMVEHLTNNKSKNIDPFQLFQDSISRYAMPIRHNIDYTRDLVDGIVKRKSFLHNDKEILKYFSEILKGTYKVISQEVFFVTKKTKHHASKQIPMYFSSSATKSLIELFFYIQYTAEEGDLLIIDEPELNLHPDNHMKIARLLAHLSNKGICIFITTHSDYLIKELNNLIRLNHKMSNKEKIMKKYDYKEHDVLDCDKISAYINDYGNVKKVPMDDMGMEIKSFDDTINTLSNAMDDIYFNIEE
ncbi:MAG: AAA family ATPase [Campylobacterales bacterium]|nr:AAA family ATPase [Campylobacterales bacterium]